MNKRLKANLTYLFDMLAYGVLVGIGIIVLLFALDMPPQERKSVPEKPVLKSSFHSYNPTKYKF